jgi:hypothetical protein
VSTSEWDFFVSYTQADRAWAEWIAWELEEAGHRVLVQAWDFVPGSNWIQGMQAGVAGAARTIALLSDVYLDSIYGNAEWQAAWAADPAGQDSKLLVVRLADCERRGLLAGVVSIDLFGVPEAKAKARLRDMVDRAVTGRAKPSEAPRFPPHARAIVREAHFPGRLPRIWNVAARHPRFVGRQAALAQVAASLAARSTVTVHSLRGMGGVGKTQLANEFAYAHAANYDLVWWISAEQPALIADQFVRLAKRLGVDADGDPETLRMVVFEALSEAPGWLLIFDNADAVDAVRAWTPSVPMPAGVAGHVLVTTRRAGFADLGPVHDLDVVDQAEAIQLMRGRMPGLPEQVAGEIAQELGRLPLALEQAAAYLDKTGMPTRDYLRLLRTRSQEVYRKGRVGTRPDTVATLWDLSFERVGSANEAAMQLLSLCAYLAAEPIPLNLFTGHVDELPEPLAAVAADDLAFNDAIGVVIDYSLAKRTPAGLQLHRLVQAALRDRDAMPAHLGGAGQDG